MFFFFYFFLVDSWAVSTETPTTRFVIVLTFDIPDEVTALNEVIKSVKMADLSHIVGPIHIATADIADRVLAEFNKDAP